LLTLYFDEAGFIETFQTPPFIDEFRVDILVDAGKAENMPATKESNQHLAIMVLVKFTITAFAND